MKSITYVVILLPLLLSIISIIDHSYDHIMVVFLEIKWLVRYVVENARPYKVGLSCGVARIETPNGTSIHGLCIC
ncbi:hypothetical protein M407DRAFT_245552 [Tulasnella calospora MUT 4182]|uniref:Uncharacterized protein n=1 Tax=Tulasnella calospora MUT 4182 TaxID=1051891 RepID=A0A0C3KI57_9AGAM|nr:hypothetical protein M407DRAFT_245552 [Tulasnella calospora MUT 4182]